ncbi:MAG TPA: flagellar export chaperone FliS [Marmoricola sp.]|jgi:flagellar protein FliS|nr:flagellar export chaperone FliS [Marmoricola sp.]
MTVSSAAPDTSVANATAPELLVMLYDRLVLDVQRGLEAQRDGDNVQTIDQLTHALTIVAELRHNVDVAAIKGGYDLAALYEFLNRRLVMASIGNDTAITDECLELVTDLCHTWRRLAETTQPEALAQ